MALRAEAVERARPSIEARRRPIGFGVPIALLAAAATGWWWSARMADHMMHVMSLGAFMLAWFAMMAAMMFPAISPVVKLYARASSEARVAPLPFFVSGYIALWSAVGFPAYLAWRALEAPLAEEAAWAGRLAGATLLAAAVWQLTPLKSLCLRHCRSPLSFFMRFGQSVGHPLGALRMGASHGVFCLGCCWAMFAVLVALGTMNLAWMALLTVVIVLEKNSPAGERVALVAAGAFAVVGLVLLAAPSTVGRVT